MALPQQTKQQEQERAHLRVVPDEKSTRTFGWIGWSVIALLVIAATVLTIQLVGGNETDGSFDRAEQIRQEQLAPADGFDTAEAQRLASLAPTVDNSNDVAESNRLASYAPATSDGSYEANEQQRMASLAPTVDNSNDVAESNRLASYAPATSDGSYETNEQQRMAGLAP